MRYYKTISDNYIITIGTGGGGEEIIEAEYNEMMAIIRNAPKSDGKGYKLRTDLTWEEYDLPPVVVSDDDVISAEEALEILLGGAT